jgi:hypothetical protein
LLLRYRRRCGYGESGIADHCPARRSEVAHHHHPCVDRRTRCLACCLYSLRANFPAGLNNQLDAFEADGRGGVRLAKRHTPKGLSPADRLSHAEARHGLSFAGELLRPLNLTDASEQDQLLLRAAIVKRQDQVALSVQES